MLKVFIFFMLSTLAFSTFANQSEDCKLYREIKIGMSLVQASKLLGQVKALATRHITIYRWHDPEATLTASFEDNHFSYVHFYGEGVNTIPEKFRQAKRQATTLSQLEMLLGKPDKKSQFVEKRYQFHLKSGNEIGIRINNKNRIVSIYAGFYCP